MEDNFEQLKSIKELLESGAISKIEYDKMKDDLLRESMASDGVKNAQKPSAFKLFMSKHKWKFVFLIILVISGFLLPKYLSKDPNEQGNKLAESYCDCQKKKNEAYIQRMSEFVETFDSEGYKFSKDANNIVTKINNEYEKSTLTPDVSNCFKTFELKNEDAKQEWKSTTSEGKTFWSIYETNIINNTDLVTQDEAIILLRDRIQSKMTAMLFDNPQEYENRKSNVYSILSSFYSSKESSYFDAYNYFSYNVEQYLITKNTTPTEINLIIKRVGDYINKETKLIEETLNFKAVEGNNEIWVYSTELKAFRPSLEKYQICNVWFEVKINRETKIMSYKEIKTENKRLMSAEEYNNLFNSNSPQYESEENDW